MAYDAIIIGGGPAGYACGIRLAQKGKKVAVVEKDKVGGECLNYGCIPSKALIELANSVNYLGDMKVLKAIPKIDMRDWQDWKWKMIGRLTGGVRTLLKANQADLIQGEAKIVDSRHVSVGDQLYEAENLVIATGSVPVSFDGFDGVIFNREILDVDHIPAKLVIIGGGYIGIELGTAFAKLGSSVTIIEMMDFILPGVSLELSSVVQKRLQTFGIKLMLSRKVKKVDKGKIFTVSMENGEMIEADLVLMTVGRKPNTEGLGLENISPEMEGRFIKVDKHMRTSIPNVYAIGDVAGQPMLAHKAYYEADVAADNIAGEDRESDYRAMPIVVYSDPEIAYTGKKGDKETFFPVAANGRALGMNATAGSYWLYYKDGGVITGGGIVGPHASELISEISLAVESGLSLMDIGMTIHPHPTLSEGVHESAEGGYRKQLHFKTVG
ncbi:MAG: dihydrolipoyl dehydrogenase [Thermoplasmata archaeon]